MCFSACFCLLMSIRITHTAHIPLDSTAVEVNQEMWEATGADSSEENEACR